MSFQSPAMLHPSPLATLSCESIVHIINFLDKKALGRVACICRFFKEISADLLVWKPRHLREWNMIYPWMGKAPLSWKEQARRGREIVLQPSTESVHYSLLWRRGFPNEEWARYSTQNPLKQLVILTATGEWARAASWMKERQGRADPETIELVMHAIFQSMEQRTTLVTLQLYLSLRPLLIRLSPRIGWWISNLMAAYLRTAPIALRMKKEDMITFSRKKNSIHFSHMLEGFCMIWLERGFYRNAFNTLYCLQHPHVSTLDSQIEFRRVVSEAIERTGNSSIAWEKFGDSLMRSLIPMDEKDEEHEQDYAKLETIISAYRQAINSSTEAPIEDQMRLGAKLAGVLIRKVKQPANNTEFQLGCLPVLFLKKYLQKYPHRKIDERDLCNIVQLVLSYEIDLAYVYLLDELRIGSELHRISNENRLRLSYYVIQLCLTTGRYPQALQHCIDCFQEMDPNFLDSAYFPKLRQIIYNLMNKYPETCRAVAAVPRLLPELRSIKAYALMKTHHLVEALRELSRFQGSLPLEELGWLRQLCQQNLIAVIIYSLQLCVEELDDLYSEMIDLFPRDDRFFLYHNLAVRFYFENALTEALDAAELAEADDPNHAETFILKAQIYHQMGEDSLSEISFEKAHKLDANFVRLSKDYPQENLLIFPVKELEKLSTDE